MFAVIFLHPSFSNQSAFSSEFGSTFLCESQEVSNQVHCKICRVKTVNAYWHMQPSHAADAAAMKGHYNTSSMLSTTHISYAYELSAITMFCPYHEIVNVTA